MSPSRTLAASIRVGTPATRRFRMAPELLKAALLVVALLPSIALGQTSSGKQVVSDLTNLPFTPAGGARTTLGAHVSGFVNVRSYGAKGDGSTDDTAAIQAAIDAIEATGVPGTLRFPPGTFLVSVVNLGVNVSIEGAGINATRIKMKSGANTAAVVQTKGFASLTGTSSTGGTFRSHLYDLTIDGNKAGNSAGRGLQLYGKAYHLHNLSIESAYAEGLWTEYGGADDFSSPARTLEATFSNLSIQQNGGSGWVSRGPHDQIVQGIVIYSNGGWGWDLQTAANASKVNTFLNTSGGIWVHSAPGAPSGQVGVINGTEIVGSTASGTGCLLENGGSNISAGSFSGVVGLEARANHNNVQGVIANTSTTGLALSQLGSAGVFVLTFGGNNVGDWFDAGTPNVSSLVIANSSDPAGNLFKGGLTPQGTYIVTGSKDYYLVNSTGAGTVYIGGAPTLAGDVKISGTGNVQAASANLTLTLTGNRDAADAGADVIVNTVASRSNGSLFKVQTNGSDRFRVDSSGNALATNNLYANGGTGAVLAGSLDPSSGTLSIAPNTAATVNISKLSNQTNVLGNFQVNGTVSVPNQTTALKALNITSGGSTTISTGAGTVKMSTANPGTNTAWIPIAYAGTTYYVPAWTTNAP